jgi:hypothetical protein
MGEAIFTPYGTIGRSYAWRWRRPYQEHPLLQPVSRISQSNTTGLGEIMDDGLMPDVHRPLSMVNR